MRIQLSKNFFLDEFTRSEWAARNGIEIHVEPESPIHHNLIRLCTEILQPVRDHLGPMTIWSGYRPPAVNRGVGGAAQSDHLRGCAADIVVIGHTPLEVAHWIRSAGLPFDQVIHEYGQWTHVSIPNNPPNFPADVRREALTAIKVPHPTIPDKLKTVYIDGLLSVEDARRAIA